MKMMRHRRWLLLLLLLSVGVGESWALWRAIPFTNQNRISNNGAGVFTADGNAANQYALAIADMGDLPGIKTVGEMTLSFEVTIPQSGRWQIGIGDKDVRGTNANSSTSASYNTTGLMLQISNDGGNYYRVKVNGVNQYGTNNSSAYNDAFGRAVRVDVQYNRNTGKFNYSLTDKDNGTVYFTGTNKDAPAANISIVEAYTWSNNDQVTLSNVIINYNFFFDKTDETIFIEDLVYNNPLNNAEGKSGVTYTISDGSYARRNDDNYYPIKPTGSVYNNWTEGDYISVTATATDVESTTFRMRIKTRNLLDPSTMVVAATNTFEAGTTLGMFSSQVVYMDGMTLYLGYLGHTPVVRSINGDYGLTIIDTNGYSFGNYADGHEWGTVYKIATTQAKNLTVSGFFANTSSYPLQLYSSTNAPISGKTLYNPGNGSLATATFALEANQTYLLYVPSSVFALKSLSYRDAYFEAAYAVTTIGSTYTQSVSNMESPTYSIIGKEGDIAATSVTINSSTGQVSNIMAGGALKIQATGGGKSAVYYLTIAYPATEYPGHQWNFCTAVDNDGNEVQRVLDTSDNLKTAPMPVAITTDSNGDEWRFDYKNANEGVQRDPRWYRTKAVDGDNAFIVKETNGLVFVTGGRNFYLRNDANEFTHIGIRGIGIGSFFTIPALEAGDIIEIMWRHDSSGSGSMFSATNVTDLRGKTVDEDFLITESARRGASNTRFVGYYSFIATGGDVTFTLRDVGNCDIQSIRIYKGPYRSTMRNINLSNNAAAPATTLLDNEQQVYTYNYCNQLYSTATGPAMYVLKGYRKQTSPSQTLGIDYDHSGCVTGSNAAYNPEFFTDEDAYPVTDEEKTQLYDLRKHIVGLEVYNQTWQSSNNSYNNGIIKATSGWGKVTIRMNNYTNDMKYVIGYTSDYTLTVGSAPHQTYPYTWDFTNISAQKEQGKSTNVYNTIVNGDHYDTNWTHAMSSQNGVFSLNTVNSGPTDSQYVPGAVLVTTDAALSSIRGYSDAYAQDEFDGLGFNGKISFDSDSQGASSVAMRASWRAETRLDLLSFTMDDYKIVNTTETIDGETIVTDWKNAVGTELSAGNGRIKFGADKIEECSYAACGFAFRSDGNIGSSKYILLNPARKIVAGDMIVIKALIEKLPDSDTGVSIVAEDGTLLKMLPISSRFEEKALTYIVQAGDPIIDKTLFRLYRANGNTVFISEVSITGDASSEPISREIMCETQTTITVPDLNANGKQDWLYVSASEEPTTVTNATKVISGDDGPDANSTHHVYKYKVTAAGHVLLTFGMGTRIYKIGVTHLLKEIHPVGGVGWATEIRKHAIDHTLTGYFTANDVNAYKVSYDSYDLNTATVALTPITEDGYVPEKTGVVMKLNQTTDLAKANDGKYVPLFYPSYTRDESSTHVDFPTNNLMYQKEENIDEVRRNYSEVFYGINGYDYTKFVLTNVHWTYHASTSNWGEEQQADAAGFYRLHIWGDARDDMPAHSAFLCVRSDQLPEALWNQGSAPAYTLAIRDANMPTDMDVLKADDCPSREQWYTLNGVKLNGHPTLPGLYICNGRKVVLRE